MSSATKLKVNVGKLGPLQELPQNDQAERSVLGGVLVDNAHLANAEELLTPSDFYRVEHQHVFRAMQELGREGKPIDVLTLGERLAGDPLIEGAGGHAWLSQLMDGIPRLVNVPHYVSIVRDRSMRRELVRMAADLTLAAADADDVEALAHQHEERLRELVRGNRRSTMRDFTDVMVEVMEGIEARLAKGSGLSGCPTGLADLDDLTDGLQNGDLIVLAARTSMGKTSMAMGIAEHAARRGRTVAVFSLEMSDRQLVQRILFGSAGIDHQRGRRCEFTDDQHRRLEKVAMDRKGIRIVLDKSSNVTLPQMHARCRRVKSERGLGLVVVDYLQLITPTGRRENRTQEVGQISTGLKALARDLDVPVLALSQLSREVDKRDGRPQLSDLRDSGRIEEDADLVAFIFREEVQLKRAGKQVPPDKRGAAELIIGKNRHGPCDSIRLRFRADLMRFETPARAGEEDAVVQRFDARAAAANDHPSHDEPDDVVPF